MNVANFQASRQAVQENTVLGQKSKAKASYETCHDRSFEQALVPLPNLLGEF